MTFLKLTTLKKRAFIYSLFITIGFFLIINALNSLNDEYFFYILFSIYFILLMEIFVTANHYHVIHRKKTKLKYLFEQNKLKQFLHHSLMPSLLYFGLGLFLYFNNQPGIYLLSVILSFILFSLLFQNIYSFYHHNYFINKHTNYIYDLISIILIFIWTDVLLNWQRLKEVNSSIILCLIVFLFGFLCTLAMARHAFAKDLLLVMTGFIVLLSFFTIFIIDIRSISILFLATGISSLFTVFNVVLDHYLEKNLNTEVIYEYILFFLILGSLLYLHTS